MEVLSGQSDGIYHTNNFYLYYNPAVNRFQYFRYDFDLSLGAVQSWYNMVNPNVLTWGFDSYGRLILSRILSVPSFQAIYIKYLRRHMESYFNPWSTLIDRANEIGQMVAPVSSE